MYKRLMGNNRTEIDKLVLGMGMQNKEIMRGKISNFKHHFKKVTWKPNTTESSLNIHTYYKQV